MVNALNVPYLKNAVIDIIQLQRDVAIARDKHAYQELFLYFCKPLTRFAVTIVGSKEAAEEVYSSVFLKLWDLGQGLNNVDNLRLYLFVSIKNESLNYLAKYYKFKVTDIEAVDARFLPGVYTPEESLLESELHRALHRAVRSLPVKCRMVYKLIKEDGLSYKEVADILGISVNTIEGHMTTALRKLSVSLRSYLYSDRN